MFFVLQSGEKKKDDETVDSLGEESPSFPNKRAKH